MDPLLTEITTTSLTGILGAVTGYSIRELLERAKNFINIYSITSITRRSDMIKLPVRLYEIKTAESSLFKEMKAETEFGIVFDNWDLADDLKRFWKDIKSDIEKALATSSDDTFIGEISKVFEYSHFDLWMKKFLIRNVVDHLKVERKNELIKVNEPDEDGDCYIEFPSRNQPFKVGNNPAIQSKCEILLNNIAEKNVPNLKQVFHAFLVFMDEQYDLGIQLLDDLHKVKNEQTRWVFYVQISNISKKPILYGLNPIINVKHKRNRYPLKMYVAQINEREKLVDSKRPILISPGKTIDIAIISKDIERDLNYGTIIRTVFEKNLGRVFIKWPIIKPGLIQRSIISSKSQTIEECHFTP